MKRIIISAIAALIATTIALSAQVGYGPNVGVISGGGGGGGATAGSCIAGSVMTAITVGLSPTCVNTVAAGTITTSAPFSFTQTWNAGAVAFNAFVVNATSTASAAASSLLKLQVASSDMFSVDKTGIVQLGSGKSKISSDADGNLLFTASAGGNPTQIKFGSAVYLRVEGNGLAIYNPSLASYYDLNAGIVTTTGAVDSTGIVKARGGVALGNNTSPTLSASIPTITSGFGTTPSISTSTSGGSFVFRVTVGTGGVATSGILGFGTAATGWNCFVSDMTGGIATRQTAATTSAVTITAGSAWAASSVLIFHCAAF